MTTPLWVEVFLVLVGLAFIAAAGEFLVNGAPMIGLGATIIGLGLVVGGGLGVRRELEMK